MYVLEKLSRVLNSHSLSFPAIPRELDAQLKCADMGITVYPEPHGEPDCSQQARHPGGMDIVDKGSVMLT
jgi:hypothetical protein